MGLIEEVSFEVRGREGWEEIRDELDGWACLEEEEDKHEALAKGMKELSCTGVEDHGEDDVEVVAAGEEAALEVERGDRGALPLHSGVVDGTATLLVAFGMLDFVDVDMAARAVSSLAECTAADADLGVERVLEAVGGAMTLQESDVRSNRCRSSVELTSDLLSCCCAAWSSLARTVTTTRRLTSDRRKVKAARGGCACSIALIRVRVRCVVIHRLLLCVCLLLDAILERASFACVVTSLASAVRVD